MIVAFIIIVIFIVLIVVGAWNSAKNDKIKKEQREIFVRDTLNSHPEFGEYKLYYGSKDTILLLSQEGYYGYFTGDNQFFSGIIHEIKSIKFVTVSYGRKGGAHGEISYQLEFSRFQNPLVSLPFGYYQGGDDKASKKNIFNEVKSTFDYIKKNSKLKSFSDGHFVGTLNSEK